MITLIWLQYNTMLAHILTDFEQVMRSQLHVFLEGQIDQALNQKKA